MNEALRAVYIVTGVVLMGFAMLTLGDASHPRRRGTATFWFLLGLIFVDGDWLPHWISGLLVLAMVLIDGAGGVSKAPPVERPAPSSLGRRIFWPVLLIPILTFACALAVRPFGLDVNQAALVGLGVGGVAAVVAAGRITGCSARDMLDEGRRLNETMGSVNILPQLLASLGVIFTAAGIGTMLAAGITHLVEPHHLFLLVLANCVAMSAFTILMGNSFAAIPVIVSGILVPLIVKPFGVPAEMAAIITLTAGSSGTLCTPMAANFNMVPAALLEMRNPYGVIKFQLPFAAVIWSCHVLLLWALCRALATGS